MASRSWFQSNAGFAARLVLALGAGALGGCHTPPAPLSVPPPVQVVPASVPAPRPEAPLGDEIIVADHLFHTGTRVVTWREPGGYDAYRNEHEPEPVAKKGQAPAAPAPGRDYEERLLAPRPGEKSARRVVEPGLAALQGAVDQFVLHYDNVGLSKFCFDTLQRRGLSVHFLLDVDGTIYQTLDLQDRALHATTANSRSIGIEIANIGAFPPAEAALLAQWYRADATGQIRLRLVPPAEAGGPGIRTANFVARPARAAPVRGLVQGRELVQYDYTPEQYAALIKLTAALCRVFPLLKCDYPRDAAGRLVTHKLPDAALEKYQGVLGHYHIQENKTDPGPALDWDRLITGARGELAK